MRLSDPRLPLEPLWAYLRPENSAELSVMLGVNDTAVRRWMCDGVPLSRCDEVAVRIGLHPILIWGEAWQKAEDADLATREAFREWQVERRRERHRKYEAQRRGRRRDRAAMGKAAEGTSERELAEDSVRPR